MLAAEAATELLDIETAAVRLLSQNEHSVAQLTKKLCAKGFDEEPVQQVLADLVERNLLSDRRFAEQYLSFRSQKGFGPVRIAQEMREKGIDESLVDEVFSESEPDWESLLVRALRKKFGLSPVLNYNDRAKRARFLEYRGFPVSMIRKKLFDD